MTQQKRVRISVHKFSSCDGCQLAFLNAVNEVLALNDWIEILHFAEAGPCDPEAEVDIAFVEGSIATPDDLERISMIRRNSSFLVSIGACATSGGLQALRNMADHDAWLKAVYAQPEYIHSLDTSTPIAEHVKVDYELWGCPVNTRQLMYCIRSWLMGGSPETEFDSVCTECKRNNNTCVVVSQQRPCMGPVTRAGCGAICPSLDRDCYGCYGPASLTNTEALAHQFEVMQLADVDIANRFLQINNHSKAFNTTGRRYRKTDER